MIHHEWFTGNYRTWEEAKKNCNGYESLNILQKVKSSILKVKNGEAVYERDSVLFDKIEYSFPLLVFLLYVASASDQILNLIDFGGSLGSSYFQNKKYLHYLKKISWNVIEQKHFVECGKQNLEDEILKFYFTIEQCLEKENINAVLFSSSLPYLKNPYQVLLSVFDKKIKYIIIDRTPFFVEDLPDRITIEHVPKEIYEADYPAWFFNMNKFKDFATKNNYKIIDEFNSFESWETSKDKAQNKCILLEKL